MRWKEGKSVLFISFCLMRIVRLYVLTHTLLFKDKERYIDYFFAPPVTQGVTAPSSEGAFVGVITVSSEPDYENIYFKIKVTLLVRRCSDDKRKDY